MIKLSELLDESNASDQAARLGLTYMSFGRWGKDGKVTHKSQKGELVPVDDEPLASLDYTPTRHGADVIPRMPSLKKRATSRISPKRIARHNMGIKMPKGLGLLTNPEKAIYNKIYNYLTFGL
jgi:hypothetical protein